MFVNFGGVCLLLLTAIVFARAQVAKVPLSDDEISRSSDRNDRQDVIYQNTNNDPAGLVDTHPNFKPRKISSLSQDQKYSPGVNSDKNYKLFGTDLGSSSDPNNEAALGDSSFEFSAQDEVLFINEGVLPPVTDLNQGELHENPHQRKVLPPVTDLNQGELHENPHQRKVLPPVTDLNQGEFHKNPHQRKVRGENEPPSATVGSGGVVSKGEQFNFEFNYTIDVSEMSLACLHDSARQLVLTLNHVSILFQELQKKYANWAYNTSWVDYCHLIHEELDARHVPLLPILPEDFNHSVIKSDKTTTLPPFKPDAETSLDRVLRDTYSVMVLCKAATDSVLLEQALSSYPLIGDLTELNGRLERVLGVLWNVLAKCNVDPNPEPLQHILDFFSERETVDDIKRRGFLTIYHTERAVDYVKHILKEIDPSLQDLL